HPHDHGRSGSSRVGSLSRPCRTVRRRTPRQETPMPPRLLGSYATPAFDYGDVVTCARRGDVRIVGLSEAPIPWPIGQRLPRGRARALVLYGDLAEAVRRESAPAAAAAAPG